MPTVIPVPSTRSDGKTRYRCQVRKKGIVASKTFPAEKLAWSWGYDLEKQIEEGTYQRARKLEISLADMIDSYKKVVTPQKKSRKNEKTFLGLLKRQPIADKPLLLVEPADVQQLASDLSKDRKPSSVLRYLALLSHVFEHARAYHGHLVENPVKAIQKPRVSNGRDRRLREGEEKKILAAADAQANPEVGVIVRLALCTAMRRSEILGLAWERINLRQQRALLPDTKNNTARTVLLWNEGVEALKRIKPKKKKTGPVFHLTSEGLKSAWRRILAKSKIENLTFHDLRHEATSRLFDQRGMNLAQVQTLTGHKDVKMLMRYTHPDLDEMLKKGNKSSNPT